MTAKNKTIIDLKIAPLRFRDSNKISFQAMPLGKDDENIEYLVQQLQKLDKDIVIGELNLQQCKIKKGHLPILAQLTNVRKLNVSRNDMEIVSEEDAELLRSLAENPSIEVINFRVTYISEFGGNVLAKFTTQSELILKTCELSSELLETIEQKTKKIWKIGNLLLVKIAIWIQQTRLACYFSPR